MITRLLENWPLKLGAFLLATFVWFFVSTSEVTTTQRSMLVPLAVEGVGERRVAVGLPDVVEVSVSGPSNRVDRLRPENIEAVLDLTDLSGEFQQTIDVRPPQGIELIRANPEQVIGFLEQVSSKQVPVVVVWLLEPSPDARIEAVAQPTTVSVSARDEILARVVRVVAPARAASETTDVTLFAADDRGLPVRDVTISPATATVSTTEQGIFVRREAAIAFEAPTLERVSSASFDPTQVDLIGPPSALEGIESVVARVDPETVPTQPGRYTLPVRIQLPSGVVAAGSLTAAVTVIDPTLSP